MHCSPNYVRAGTPKQCSHILVKTIAYKEIKWNLVGHGTYSSTAICREKKFSTILRGLFGAFGGI
jgi:hypothetical protein